jgi:hypothetical protein
MSHDFVSVSSLQADAWTVWNESYHVADADAYRRLAHTLYQQSWRERIQARFALLDEQNARLDALLAQRLPGDAN